MDKNLLVVGGVVAAIIVGIGGYKIKKDSEARALAEQKQAAVEAMTAEDLIEQTSDTLPNVADCLINMKLDGTPVSMKYSMQFTKDLTYLTGRYATDPEGDAFNNPLAQYIETIGDISTFYTSNPEAGYSYDESAWIKETITDYKPLSELPAALENAEIDEKTKAPEYTAYALKGTLNKDTFPYFFYNLMGKESMPVCDVTIAIDKETKYIIGIEFSQPDGAGSAISDFHCVMNFSSVAEAASFSVEDNARVGGSEEGCYLYYIKKEHAGDYATTEEN